MKETEDDINPEEYNIVTECHSVMINEEQNSFYISKCQIRLITMRLKIFYCNYYQFCFCTSYFLTINIGFSYGKNYLQVLETTVIVIIVVDDGGGVVVYVVVVVLFAVADHIVKTLS